MSATPPPGESAMESPALAPSAEEESPPLKVDIAYGMITLATSTLWTVVGSWLLYFYLPPEGEPLVPPALYSGAILFTRVANALITPPVGYLSDRARTRWGRRIPFILLSGAPLIAFFLLLWIPPIDGESVYNLLYLVLVLGSYNIAYVLNQVPYTALLPEIARTDHHRVRISAWTSGSLLIGMIVGGIAGLIIDQAGYFRTALLYGAYMLPFLYIPLLIIREPPHPAEEKRRSLNLKESVTAMFENKPFLIMTATGICYWSITTLTQASIPYIATEICRLSTSDTLIFYLPAVLAALLCYPLITWLSDRFGKDQVFKWALLASALALPQLALIGERIPIPLKIQGVVWITLQAITLAPVVMLPPAFGAEITDHDEQITGRRREGTYYATWRLLDQVIKGIAAAGLPILFLLGKSQTDPNGPLGVRMVGVVGGILLFAGFLIFRHYPLRGGDSQESES